MSETHNRHEDVFFGIKLSMHWWRSLNGTLRPNLDPKQTQAEGDE